MLQFNEDLDDEAKAKPPFWRRWKFYRTSFLFLTRCDVCCTKKSNPHAMHDVWDLPDQLMPALLRLQYYE